jgi:hypothetical protein
MIMFPTRPGRSVCSVDDLCGVANAIRDFASRKMSMSPGLRAFAV